MARQKGNSSRPSKLELQVLAVLWGRGPSTVREVMELLPDGKERAYTSVLSVMQVMEKKGMLRHGHKGNSYVYRPCQNRQAVVGPLMKQLVSNVFGGSRVSMMQSLLGGGRLSEDEMAELEELVRQNRK